MAHLTNNDLANKKKHHLIAQYLVLMVVSCVKVGCTWSCAMDLTSSGKLIFKNFDVGDTGLSGFQHASLKVIKK